MTDEQFEKTLKNWASEERDAMPTLRPRQEMYQVLKAKRRKVFFPVFARWATAGVAVVVLAVAALFHPAVFQKPEQPGRRQETQLKETPMSADAESEGLREHLKEERAESETPTSGGMAKSVAPSSALSEGDISFTAPPASRTEGLTASKKSIQPTETQVFSSPPMEKAERGNSREAQEMAEPPGMSSQKASPQTVESLFLANAMNKRDASPSVKLCRVDENVKGMEKLQIGPKTFLLKDNVWIDTEHSAQKKLIALQRDSQAYHDLLTALPELQQYFAHCQSMIVNIGACSIELTDEGQTTLTREELQELLTEESSGSQ